MMDFTPKFIKNQLYKRPEIDPNKCIKCGICVDSCPVEGKALNFKDNDKTKPPVYNYSKCIRCYCCQEMCPKKAIEPNRPPIGKFLKKIFK
jgi:ferredoxin